MIPMKSVPASPRHARIYQSFAAWLKKEAADVPADELLAILSNIVGKTVALQDQRKFTPAMAMEIVARNIEAGNAEALAEIARAGGRPT